MLSYLELCALVNTGVIRNVEEKQINPASIDLRLGKTILLEYPVDYNEVVLKDRRTLRFKEIDISSAPISLLPGTFCLAQTIEEFYFPDDIVGEFKLKSSVARIGINNLLAGFCDPGWTGSVLTMQLVNTTQFHSIVLNYGDAIGQMVFHRVTKVPKERSYSVVGRYNNDSSVSPIKK